MLIAWQWVAWLMEITMNHGFTKPHIEYNGWKAQWECRSRDGFAGEGNTPSAAYASYVMRRYSWDCAMKTNNKE